jgi:hypothetical protein
MIRSCELTASGAANKALRLLSFIRSFFLNLLVPGYDPEIYNLKFILDIDFSSSRFSFPSLRKLNLTFLGQRVMRRT